MSTSLFALLKAVPWSDVIGSAPLVAEGAKKLWTTVARKPAPQAGEDSSEAPTLSALEARLAASELAQAELHEQMLASSSLITALAEQNTQLIKATQNHRLQLRWLMLLSVVLALGLLAVVTFVATRV